MDIDAGVVWHDLVCHCVAQGWYGIENLALIPGLVGAAPIQNIGAYGVEFADVCLAVAVFDSRSGQHRWLTRDQCGFGYRTSRFAHEASLIVTRVRCQLHHGAFCPTLTYAGLQGLAAASAQQVMQRVVALRQSKLHDPADTPNVGSFFHNPVVDAPQLQALQQQYSDIPVTTELADNRYKISAAWLIEACGLKGYADARFGDAKISTKHALCIVNTGDATLQHVLDLAAMVQHTVAQRFGVDLVMEPKCL